MLIKTAFITKKTGFVFRSYQRKGFNRKKTGFIWRKHTQKKVDLIKTGFTSIKTVFTKSFFSVRVQRKEKKREAFLPTVFVASRGQPIFFKGSCWKLFNIRKRLEEKLFFSFLFFARAQKKKLW